MVVEKKINKLVTVHIVDDLIYLAVSRISKNNHYKIKYTAQFPLNGAALGEYVSKKRLKRYPVYLVLGGKQIVTRVINIPNLPQEEIRQALTWEVPKYIPIPSEELIFDFEVLNKVSTPSGEQLQIMIIAARKQYIENYCDILVNSGLKPMIVDIEGIVLKYLYSCLENSKDNTNVCCVYLDEHRGVFSFINNNNLFFIHNVEWEQEIIINRLSSEYQRVNNYLQRQMQMPNVTDIYIFGQVDETLFESLRAELGLNVNCVNMTDNALKINTREEDPHYTFAIGLNLREVNNGN
ncbi:MAG: hypothetical protein JM58_01350 [Peptococcaceae bacterium BICA1-8]|nr:MAG: hypothetical protein JM58_01350 [Peptococcaceae bacterium BICA1-8]